MTLYQQKRQFLNKINKRIKTLTSRAGVDRSDIENLITVNGAWFTESGNLNLTTEAYAENKENIEKLINEAVPTYFELREEIRGDLLLRAGEHVGEEVDTSLENLHREMSKHFSFWSNWEEQSKEYYDMQKSLLGPAKLTEDDIRHLDLADLSFEEQKLIRDELPRRMRELGRDMRNGGVSPSELWEQLEEIRGVQKKVWGE